VAVAVVVRAHTYNIRPGTFTRQPTDRYWCFPVRPPSAGHRRRRHRRRRRRPAHTRVHNIMLL